MNALQQSGLSFSSDLAAAIPLQSGRLPQPTPPGPPPAIGGSPSRTVLIVDPSGSFREVLQPAIIDLTGCDIIYVRTALEVEETIADGLVGVLALVSVQLGGNTSRVIQTLLHGGWRRVIAITSLGLPIQPVIEAVGAGASGVVSVAVAGRHPDPRHPTHLLSDREVQVVRLLAEGCTNKEIARQLSLSSLTVKNHLARIGRKFGVGDRAHIVAIACRGGVIPGLRPSVTIGI